MKRFLITVLLASCSLPALAADVGVSISIGDPGYYGRIDIGSYYPPPQVIYAEPVIVEHRVFVGRPIYMHVPHGHAKNWRKHCHRYDACGRRVYFVQNDWYEHTYAPEYRERHHKHGKKGKKHRHG